MKLECRKGDGRANNEKNNDKKGHLWRWHTLYNPGCGRQSNPSRGGREMKTEKKVALGIAGISIASVLALWYLRKPSNVVLWFDFSPENIDGNIVIDKSGHENHGVIYGAQLTDEGLYFDGDDYVEVPHHESLNITKGIAIQVQAKVTDFSKDYQYFVFKLQSIAEIPARTGYALATLRGKVQLASAVNYEWRLSYSDQILEVGQWYNIEGKRKGAKGHIDIDGARTFFTYPESYWDVGEDPLWIGNGWGGANPLTGVIKEVKIYRLGRL